MNKRGASGLFQDSCWAEFIVFAKQIFLLSIKKQTTNQNLHNLYETCLAEFIFFAKQIFLLSIKKQTTDQNLYNLYETLAGNQ